MGANGTVPFLAIVTIVTSGLKAGRWRQVDLEVEYGRDGILLVPKL